jgi:hypothetical protein
MEGAIETSFSALLTLVEEVTGKAPATPEELQALTRLSDTFLKDENEIDLLSVLNIAKGIKPDYKDRKPNVVLHATQVRDTKTGSEIIKGEPIPMFVNVTQKGKKKILHLTPENWEEIKEGIEKYLGVEKLHKQPRGYLKTTAKLVGKATDEKTLFSLPEVIPESGGNFLREVISRNTAILGNYLLQLWQQNGEGTLVINNLSPIAEIMGNSNYEIKIYLLYLGGYVYPIIDKDEEGLTITTEQLFKVKFRYDNKVKDKYAGRKFTEIGSGLTKFIKDENFSSIEITPSSLFIKALEGKGLGNVLVVNDKFVKLALSLTDIAYKIFTYSASNKPNQKIAEDNLVKHLGLEKQIKTQGKPRVRATILKGLQELQDKEHIKSYSYEEAKGMYLFTYSDKYVRHQELKKGKNLNL